MLRLRRLWHVLRGHDVMPLAPQVTAGPRLQCLDCYFASGGKRGVWW